MRNPNSPDTHFHTHLNGYYLFPARKPLPSRVLTPPEAFDPTLRTQPLEGRPDKVQPNPWAFSLKLSDTERPHRPFYRPRNRLGLRTGTGHLFLCNPAESHDSGFTFCGLRPDSGRGPPRQLPCPVCWPSLLHLEADGSPCWGRRCAWRCHELPDGFEDHPELGVVLLLQIL